MSARRGVILVFVGGFAFLWLLHHIQLDNGWLLWDWLNAH